MPKPHYITLEIGGDRADIDSNAPVPEVTYAIEDEDDFEKKKAAESFDLDLPATIHNDKIHNTMHNPSVVDNSTGQVYDNFKPAKYIANGEEILVGKYIQQSVVEKNGRPVRYKGKIYGLNGDWIIDLKEKTIFDFINPVAHVLDATTIIASWNFDGRSEVLDYVYAPIHFLKRFGDFPDNDPDQDPLDDNVLISDMKPSISPYWILYRGFKSVGYRIVSTFMDTDYYRRGVMPWTWGGFSFIDDSRWEPLRFLARQENSLRIEGDYNNFPDLTVRDDLPGAFDNSNLYTYTSAATVLPFMMMWTYPTAPANLNLGKVNVTLSARVNVKWNLRGESSTSDVTVLWYVNGVQMQTSAILNENGTLLGTTGQDFVEVFFTTDINPGDYIGARVGLVQNQALLGFARVDIQVESFTLDLVKLTEGSSVGMSNYPKFKNYKWLDLLRGEIDMFDLLIQTDPIRKEVYIEPAHAYQIDGVDFVGFYNRKQLEWSDKVDLSQESELELFSDYERELIFSFKPDDTDGGLKKVQDRNQATIGASKYLLPDRFKTEKKEKENRFYSAVMHYEHTAFQFVTQVTPQLIALIPENVANTSGSESENIFQPKRAYYKGNVGGVGGWRFNGSTYNTLPFMFAVNYHAGGENDPVLSYSDQNIKGAIGTGLLKKFFLQRLANIRYGRRYNPLFIRLTNYDIGNFLHRESIIVEDIEYIITSINGYNPLEKDSTAVRMWLFMPKAVIDINNTYPSISNLQTGAPSNTFDIRYWPHLLLSSDIP